MTTLIKSRSVPLSSTFYTQQFRASINDSELYTAISLLEVMFLREGYVNLPALFTLSHAQLTNIIIALATS